MDDVGVTTATFHAPVLLLLAVVEKKAQNSKGIRCESTTEGGDINFGSKLTVASRPIGYHEGEWQLLLTWLL
jgi:hypothetical protein